MHRTTWHILRCNNSPCSSPCNNKCSSPCSNSKCSSLITCRRTSYKPNSSNKLKCRTCSSSLLEWIKSTTIMEIPRTLIPCHRSFRISINWLSTTNISSSLCSKRRLTHNLEIQPWASKWVDTVVMAATKTKAYSNLRLRESKKSPLKRCSSLQLVWVPWNKQSQTRSRLSIFLNISASSPNARMLPRLSVAPLFSARTSGVVNVSAMITRVIWACFSCRRSRSERSIVSHNKKSSAKMKSMMQTGVSNAPTDVYSRCSSFSVSWLVSSTWCSSWVQSKMRPLNMNSKLGLLSQNCEWTNSSLPLQVK